jgi:hypothetical protein
MKTIQNNNFELVDFRTHAGEREIENYCICERLRQFWFLFGSISFGSSQNTKNTSSEDLDASLK